MVPGLVVFYPCFTSRVFRRSLMRFFNPVIRPKFSLKAAFPFSVGWFRNRTGTVTSSARKGLHSTSGAAQPLVKPVIWFARAVVNWRSLFIAKSAYYPAPRAYFQSKILFLFCFEMAAEWQPWNRAISGPRKTYCVPSFQLDENVSRAMCQLWRKKVTNHVPRELDSHVTRSWTSNLQLREIYVPVAPSKQFLFFAFCMAKKLIEQKAAGSLPCYSTLGKSKLSVLNEA